MPLRSFWKKEDSIMDEDVTALKVGPAARSEKTARAKKRERGTESLRLYRWKKHQTGDQGNDSTGSSLGATLHGILSMRLPEKFRKDLEEKIGGLKLPKFMTFAQGLALLELTASFSRDSKVEIIREIRETVEGRAGPQVHVSGERNSAAPQSCENASSTEDPILLGIVKILKRRRETET
jgi:hypothetical protein